MHASIYDKNLKALKGRNQFLYSKLCDLSENTKFAVFANQDPIDVNIKEIATNSFLYKKPLIDVSKDIEQAQALSRYPFLVYFGLGNGVLFKALLQNFKFLEALYVIEPEIEIIFIALHIIDFSEEILSKKLKLFLSEQVEYFVIRESISRDGLAAYLRLYDLKITRQFYAKYIEELVRINKIFINSIEHFVKSHGNCVKDTLVGDEHFIANLPLMLRSTPFHDLLTKRPSDTAILVATGPSLNKQLELLRSAQKQATIIAVDASMPVLEKAGIKPDIVCSIERVEATAKFFEATSAEFHKDITFVCAALQHKKIFENIKGGQLIIAMRPFHFMKQFEFHNYGYCGIGMSSANMAYDVAYLMGFKTLILIGQDLAYADDGKSHAAGHVYGEDEKTDEYDANITVPAWGGNGSVVTTEVWTLFRNYFVSNIAEAQDNMITVNATEGGSRIDGSVEVTFKEALEKCVYFQPEKEKIILEPTQKAVAALLITSAKFKVDDILKYAEETKAELEELFLELTKFCNETVELNNQGNTAQIDFKEMEVLTDKLEKVKDKFQDPVFYDLFWEIVQSFILSQEMLIATILVRPVVNETEKQIKMIEFLFAHKQWLFVLAGAIDATIFVINRSKANVLHAALESQEYLNKLAQKND
ncbi:MAG: hypothetical protein RL154_474 [Pseudomonadota bacterium]|jgi:hypothetical protein